jgi:hypothetical protein
MARSEDTARPGSDGFEGEVAGLGLSDLVQLNARSRFSGCVRIRHQGNLGTIFFRDGEIVHAEQGSRIGEEAFCDILGWPAGRFSVEPNVVTARRTIQKRCEHLLLDAHRVLDERGAVPREPPARTPAPARPAGPGGAVQLVRNVPGVVEAVVLTREGKRVGEDGYPSEVLAGQAVYLAMFGTELGALFQAGELRFASAQGTRRHLLVFTARSHYLGVFADPESEIGAVDAAIRATLGSGR